MSYRLSVCSNTIVRFGRKIDNIGLETGHDFNDLFETAAFVTMLYENLHSSADRLSILQEASH